MLLRSRLLTKNAKPDWGKNTLQIYSEQFENKFNLNFAKIEKKTRTNVHKYLVSTLNLLWKYIFQLGNYVKFKFKNNFKFVEKYNNYFIFFYKM